MKTWGIGMGRKYFYLLETGTKKPLAKKPISEFKGDEVHNWAEQEYKIIIRKREIEERKKECEEIAKKKGLKFLEWDKISQKRKDILLSKYKLIKKYFIYIDFSRRIRNVDWHSAWDNIVQEIMIAQGLGEENEERI